MAPKFPFKPEQTPPQSLAPTMAPPTSVEMEEELQRRLTEALKCQVCKPSRHFKAQQANDRSAAIRAIQKRISYLRSCRRWSKMVVEERRRVVEEEYRRKIRERGQSDSFQSVQVHHSDKYDEEAELRWMMENFESQIEEEMAKSKLQEAGRKRVNYQENSDSDDEELAIKNEGGEDEDDSSKDGQSSSKTETESQTTAERKTASWRKSESADAESDEDAKTRRSKHICAAHPTISATKKRSASVGEDEKREKTVVYTAISRGIAISESSGAKRARSVGWPWFKVGGA